MGVFKKDESVKTVSTIQKVESKPHRSVIGKTLFIKGELSSDEEVLIEGKIEGKIKIQHRVIIGKNGTVNADIEAREVVIKGTVNGNVNCSYKVEVIPEGILNGNIVSERVVLAEGAIFKGNIDMNTATPPQPPGKSDQEELKEVEKKEVSEEKLEGDKKADTKAAKASKKDKES